MILKWNYRGSEIVFLSSQVRVSQSKKKKKRPQGKDEDKGSRLRSLLRTQKDLRVCSKT